MNVLLLDQFSDPGGAQQALVEFLPAILRRGWRALVGIPGNGKLFEQIRALGVEVERIDCGPRRQTLRLATQIRRLADRAAADLIYLNGPRLLPAAALAGMSRPVIFHSHSVVTSNAARAVARVALRHLNARVVANCEFVAKQWRKSVRPEKIAVIWNGVAGPSALLPPRRDGGLCVGCIGRISPEKGQREFVAAAARIHAALPHCRFVICGEALFNSEAQRYAAEVRHAAAGLPMEFYGWVTGIYSALASFDVLLVPCVGPEATTRVILEAFAAGVPVVAFETGGIAEVVDRGVTGVLTSSPEEMAQETIALLRDPARRTAMANAAREAWRQRFTQERFHERLLAVMEKLNGETPVR